jgi:hypothetical protein
MATGIGSSGADCGITSGSLVTRAKSECAAKQVELSWRARARLPDPRSAEHNTIDHFPDGTLCRSSSKKLKMKENLLPDESSVVAGAFSTAKRLPSG